MSERASLTARAAETNSTRKSLSLKRVKFAGNSEQRLGCQRRRIRRPISRSIMDIMTSYLQNRCFPERREHAVKQILIGTGTARRYSTSVD